MNPYFPTTFTFMDTPQPTYAFNQPITTAPFRQPYAQPAQPQPVNIESIYTTVQPYYNKEFLLTTFGNKPEYIQIFLTLSH